MKKRLVSLVCAVGLSFAVLPFSGCGPRGNDIDINKTQLYVGTLNQGIGMEWLEKAADRFEAYYANTPFEEGKVGVQIIPEPVDGAASLINTFRHERVEVVFNEGVDYDAWVKQGLLLEITDVVSGENADLSAYGDPEGTTIESKMDSAASSYYKQDDKYYAIPFYQATNGIMYNIDLWEKNGYYFKEGGGWTGNVAEATVGQDNKKGTFDDGLPRTFDDFYTLCEHIKNDGTDTIPIGWTGAYDLSYINAFLFCMAADIDGAEQFRLNFTFDGDAEGLITGFDSDGKPIISDKSEPIEPQTGYKLYKQQGKFYALSFIENIIDRGYYSPKLLNNQTVEHTIMQSYFVTTEEYGGTVLGQDVAMMIEGTWWFNESRNYLAVNESKGGGKYNQQFGIMPLPKPTEEHVKDGYTMFDNKSSACFINANIAESKIELAKEFIKFVHSNESLIEFTETVSMTKPYTYSIDESSSNLAPYAQQLIEVTQASDLVYPFSNSNMYTRRRGTLLSSTVWATMIGEHSYNHPTTDFKDGVSAVDYFNNLLFADPDYWQNIFEYDF